MYDHQSRNARDLLITISKSLEVLSHSKSTHHGDTLVVFSPEHARTIGDDGWSKADMRDFLWHRLRKPVSELVPGLDGGEGLPPRVLAKFPDPETDTTLIPKFREPSNIKFLVAGGTAGRFSAVIHGWTGSLALADRIEVRQPPAPPKPSLRMRTRRFRPEPCIGRSYPRPQLPPS